MVSRLTLTKRRILGIVFVCTILIAGLAVWWQTGRVAEAAVIEPHPGLVGWWRFDEGSGTTASDSSENGNNGAVYGATWTEGKYSTALHFDGTNYVTLGDVLDIGTADLTIGCWFKTSVTGAMMGLISKRVSGAAGYRLLIHSNNKVTAEFNDGVHSTFAIPQISTTGKFQDGEWHFVVATIDRDGYMTLYIDALLENSVGISSGDGIDVNVATVLYIGKSEWFLNGMIDEVRIYNRVLSAAEIQESFQKGPDFSSKVLAKVPSGTTQVVVTVSWQGIGSINATIQSPTEDYTEETASVYQKAIYSTTDGTSTMLNIKRLSITVTALSSDENWYVMLEFDNAEDYRITVETKN